MYHAHVGSLLMYCNVIWANVYETTLTPLVLILKRIIRNVSKSEFRAHTAPLFKNMKILDLEGSRKLSLALYFFKYKDINIPPLEANHNYPTRQRAMLRPPQHRLTQFHNSFLYQGPRLWNTLATECPRDVVEAPNINLFKRRLKRYLLK